jgi:DNA-3-methyladenine glycosylase I
MINDRQRCPWPQSDRLMIEYHDHEWGVPVHDDRKWFEFMVLDTFQAGLSWRTILYKRENFRGAFDNFDFSKIARYDEEKIASLLENRGIIRNKLKIFSTMTNARAYLEITARHGTFDSYIWQFTGGEPKINRWDHASQVPVTTPESDRMSRELKNNGFKFVGSTTCYAFMQAGGMVNDHLTTCFRHQECIAPAVGGSPAVPPKG